MGGWRAGYCLLGGAVAAHTAQLHRATAASGRVLAAPTFPAAASGRKSEAKILFPAHQKYVRGGSVGSGGAHLGGGWVGRRRPGWSGQWVTGVRLTHPPFGSGLRGVEKSAQMADGREGLLPAAAGATTSEEIQEKMGLDDQDTADEMVLCLRCSTRPLCDLLCIFFKYVLYRPR